jgi:hypothetical protein
LADASAEDGGGADGATPEIDAGAPTDFYDLAWSAPVLVDLAGTPDPCGSDQALDPILTSDLRWLAVSRFESDCSTRRFHVSAWNDGAPAWVDMLGPLVPGGTEHNGHLWNGGPAGRPSDELLMFTIDGTGGPRELRAAWLGGSPPLGAGAVMRVTTLDGPAAEDGPCVTVDGRRIVLSIDGDVVEAVGMPPDGFGATSRVPPAADPSVDEVDPAISPDGRVLVFARIEPTSQPDLWVTRRRDAGEAWEGGAPLGAFNTGDGEWDPFIATNGDLLFTRRTGGAQHVFLARAVAP